MFCAAHAEADVLFTYNGFANTSGLNLLGNAGTAVTGDGTVLRVAPATTNQSGAAYSTTAVPLGAGNTFSSVFDFRITNAGGIDPADGSLLWWREHHPDWARLVKAWATMAPVPTAWRSNSIPLTMAAATVIAAIMWASTSGAC
jgi:hypothetical protein